MTVCSSFTGYNPSQGILDPFHSFSFLGTEEFDRFDLRAEHDPWLEYGNGPALRTLLAGLIGDRGILRQRQKMSRLLRRQVLRRIEPMLSPQPSFTPPRPTSRAQRKAAASAIFRRGRTSGAVRTVEVAPERETPTHRPQKAGTRLLPRRRMPRSLSSQPTVFAAPRPVPVFEPGIVFGTKVATKRNLKLIRYQCSTV
jgi:hypothetical protein